jgi:hypothetical protein
MADVIFLFIYVEITALFLLCRGCADICIGTNCPQGECAKAMSGPPRQAVGFVSMGKIAMFFSLVKKIMKTTLSRFKISV